MQLRKKQANPWRTAAVALLNKGSVNNAADWEGSLKRIYPRTSQEITNKEIILIKPNRK